MNQNATSAENYIQPYYILCSNQSRMSLTADFQLIVSFIFSKLRGRRHLGFQTTTNE